MSTESVFVSLNGTDKDKVEVVLRTATNGDGIYREKIKYIVFKEIGDSSNITESMSELEIAEIESPRIEAVIFYSACLACVESPHEARVLPLNKFQQLPEDEKDNWRETAYRINPHWNKQLIEQADKAVQEEAEKKKWDIEDWLRVAYDNPDAVAGAMPPFEEKVQIFGNMSDELVDEAKRVLSIAEFVDWKWTFKQILEQPEELTDAVMYMKSIGERFRTQGKKPMITRVKDWLTGNG